jgi:galactose mutarotase-like enzyme
MSPMQTFVLRSGAVQAEVIPERGAIVSRLTVAGRDVLAMDHDTLFDPGKNVRGGIPLLFPFAGRLAADRFERQGLGVVTTIRQHGFARQRAFSPVAPPPGRPFAADRLRLVLSDDDATRAVYPFRFQATVDVRLEPRGLCLSLVVWNQDDRPMPVAPGWHPYFPCPVGAKARITISGLGASFDPAALRDDVEFDFGVPAPPLGRLTAQMPSIGELTVEFSPRLRHVQLWSLPERPFVCIEPFWGPAGVICGDDADLIPPGRAHDYWVRLELQP